MVFVSVGEEEITELLASKDAKNTQRVVKRAKTLFNAFLSNGRPVSDLSKDELNQKLRLFFASVRNREGNELKKSTLSNIRYGLSKYLKEEHEIDINEPEFASSKTVYKAVGVELKKRGKGAVDHKPNISDDDMAKLYDENNIVFNPYCPGGLQRKVWFDLMYFLCRRGRENLREMKKGTFVAAKDTNGKEYVYQALDEADKNHGYVTQYLLIKYNM